VAEVAENLQAGAVAATGRRTQRPGEWSAAVDYEAAASVLEVVSISRDPRDVRLVGLLAILCSGLSFVVLLCVGVIIFQQFKKPVVITVVKQGNEVIEINDVTRGASVAGVTMRPGDITNDEKVQIAKELARGIHRINPVMRDDDNMRLINLMEGATAKQFAGDMKNSGLLKRQVEEKWTANWTPLDSSVVEGMPNTVRVLGRQELIKVVGGNRIEESHTYSMDVVLVLDERGRDPRNLNTGLRVIKFSVKEIKER